MSPRSRRAVVRVAGGLALIAGLSACHRAPVDDSPVLARVDGDPITRAELDFVRSRLQAAAPASVPGEAVVLTKLVSEHLAAGQAGKLRLDRQPGVVQALESARREALARADIDRVVDGVAPPSPAELRAYYDGHPALFAQRKIFQLQRVQAHVPDDHLAALAARVRSAHSAAEVLALARAAAPDAQVAQLPQPAETLGPVLERVAALPVGGSIVLPAPGALVALTLLGTEPAPLAFEAVAPRLRQMLFDERKRDAVLAERTRLRQAAHIEYLGEFAAHAPAPAASVAH